MTDKNDLGYEWVAVLIERLERHSEDDRNTAFARSTMGEILDALKGGQLVAPSAVVLDDGRTALDPRDVLSDTVNPEADRLIGRLTSADPDFNDCTDAAVFIRKIVVEHRGPDGFATWKDAAVAERQKRVKAEADQRAANEEIARAMHAEMSRIPGATFYNAAKEALARAASPQATATQPAQTERALTAEQVADIRRAVDARDAERWRVMESVLGEAQRNGALSMEIEIAFDALLTAAQTARGGARAD